MESHVCFHCGEDCGSSVVWHDEKPFCCNGCKSVYQILKQNKLYTYYNIETNPGSKISESANSKFEFLSNDEIVKDLLDFTDGSISKVTLFIPAIHCSSCIWLLERLQKLHSGVILSQVNFLKKEVSITYSNDKINLRQIAELLASISYEPYISLKDSTKEERQDYNKRLIYRLGVAGFCFGNIMLLSFPDYLHMEFSADSAYLKWFNWLNILFSLPVVFYSSTLYFESAFKNLFKGNINIDLPVAIGIITLFIRSLFDILSGYGPGFIDSLSGLVFFLLIGKWYQNKTYRTLSFERDYRSYFPIAVLKKRKDSEEYVPLNTLQKGDRIIVRNNELIPADSILIDELANIDYSYVTGESLPVNKTMGELIFAGGRQMGSAIELEIVKETSQSYLTRLWNEQNTKAGNKTTMTLLIDQVSKYFTLIILFIATATLIFWLFKDNLIAFQTFTAVLIVACPCALALSVPFTFGSAIRFLGTGGIYLRNVDVIERLSKVNTIIFDKTGTITQPEVWEPEWHGRELSDLHKSYLKSTVRNSVHPLSNTIYKFVEEYDLLIVNSFREDISKGIEADIGDSKIKLGSAEYLNLSAENKPDSTAVHIKINDNYMGYFLFKNTYRKGINELSTKLRKKYELHVLTGDNESERTQLEKVFHHKAHLLFKQSPYDKLNYIQKLKEQKKYTMMLGDGLNDAGALRESHVGVTVVDDIFSFTPASDIILRSSELIQIKKLLDFAKTNMTIVYMSFTLSFIYNVAGISLAVYGVLTPLIAAILMPLSSVSVVVFATLSVSFIWHRWYKKFFV